jgi:hypothetical protein
MDRVAQSPVNSLVASSRLERNCRSEGYLEAETGATATLAGLIFASMRELQMNSRKSFRNNNPDFPDNASVIPAAARTAPNHAN